MKKFRGNGAVGALLDEYERALEDLKEVIYNLSNLELSEIVDKETDDEDCRSIQSVLSHVIKAGYIYVVKIRKWMGEELDYKVVEHLSSSTEYVAALNLMFKSNEQLFLDYPDIQLEQSDPTNKISLGRGQKYDVEQLLEHAIVHILRHRRQIEKFKLIIAK